MENRITSIREEEISQIVEDSLNDVCQVGYNAAKEQVKTPFLNLVEEIPVHIVQKGQLDPLRVINVEVLAESERFIEALTESVVSRQSLFKPIAAHV